MNKIPFFLIGIGAGMVTNSLIPQISFGLSSLENSLVCLCVALSAWLFCCTRERLFEKKVAGLYQFAEFGKLSSGVFHDLINPLTSISLTMEKLKEDPNLTNNNSIKQINLALQASRRMEYFMQTARKQLKSEHHECSFSIKKEIEEATRLLEYKTRISGIEIKTDISENDNLYGNPFRFFQMIVNLLSNAIDSYKNINCPNRKSFGVVVSEIKKDHHIEISVRDKGCGIPKNVMSSIFKPFFTTKIDREGIGLGLSTTRQIIEKDFKGTINVASKYAEGSTFTLTLPIRKHNSVPSAGIEPTSAR